MHLINLSLFLVVPIEMSQDPNRYGPEATKDGHIIKQILKNIGITDYDSRVITRLLDFIYRK